MHWKLKSLLSHVSGTSVTSAIDILWHFATRDRFAVVAERRCMYAVKIVLLFVDASHIGVGRVVVAALFLHYHRRRIYRVCMCVCMWNLFLTEGKTETGKTAKRRYRYCMSAVTENRCRLISTCLTGGIFVVRREINCGKVGLSRCKKYRYIYIDIRNRDPLMNDAQPRSAVVIHHADDIYD